jgi:hypothetical protein
MQPITVTLGRFPATLAPPGVARAFELAAAFQRYTGGGGRIGEGYLLALQGAALALCWPPGVTWPAPIPPRPFRLGDGLAEWGEGAIEGLLAAGLDLEAVSAAGAQALDLALSRIPRRAEVDAARGNSSAPEAGNSGASLLSVGPGGETSAGGMG